MSHRILGLDPGTDSLGWAVVEKHDDGTYTLIKKGVLRFDAGAEGDNQGKTPAAIRREYRAARRRIYRRRLRKIELLKVLVAHGLCPFIPADDLKSWRYRKVYPMIKEFLDWQKTDEKGNRNPYLFRYLCLTEDLDLSTQEDRYILGRALYHLVQRRGFLSNRKDSLTVKSKDENAGKTKGNAKTKEDELGEIKKGIKQLEQDMADAGCTWLGQYLHLRYVGAIKPNTIRLRGLYTSRQMYVDEFEAICKKQDLEKVLGKDEVDKLRKAIFFQRKLKSQKYTMGNCTFEKLHTRCHVSHPEFEEFRMLAFINNVKVMKKDYDFEPRPLNDKERALAIEYILSRKTSCKFKAIADVIAGKNNYYCYKDDESEKGSKVYGFNYSMDTEVPNCPFTYAMRQVFGDDWRTAITRTYTRMVTGKGNVKTLQQAVDDIWHVLHDFDDEKNLLQFAKDKLQLDEEKALKFSQIKMPREIASLSLKAIRNILPFLRKGLKYSHAVFMAKVPWIMGYHYTAEFENRLIDGITNCDKRHIRDYMVESISNVTRKKEYNITQYLYHPSMTDVYPKVEIPKDEAPQLGSPETRSFRNPTAMKALHQIRYVINALLAEKIIDRTSMVHVEYPRALNNPAQRKALEGFNKWMKVKREKAENLIDEFKKETGREFSVTDDLILRVTLWLEQGGADIYSTSSDIYDGSLIAFSDVINGKCDIDHIIPRSKHGDDSQMNKVLTSAHFNRDVKKNRLPYQLRGFQEMKKNLACKLYYKPYKDLDKAVKSRHPKEQKEKENRYLQMLKRDYYKGKWERFTATKEPEGFSMWQGPGNAAITRYLGMYLRSFFYDPNNPEKKQVWIVKSPVTAKLRKMWGLQEEWEDKDRSNHCHHAKDAIVVACAGHGEMQDLYEWMKSHETGIPYKFPLPWPTFVADMNALHEDTVVYYRTKSKFDTFTLRRLKDLEKKYGKGKNREDHLYKRGLGVRESLYMDTFYACIKMKDEQGVERKQVVKREQLSKFAEHKEYIDRIVDKQVREAIREWVDGGCQGIPYMDKTHGIPINGARMTTSVKPSEVKKCRDLSEKEWKQKYLSKNDGNFCIALYKGSGKKKSYLLFSNIDVANWMKENKSKADLQTLVPESDADGLPLYAILDKGTHVIFHNGDKNEVRFWSQEELVSKLWYVTKYDIKGVIGCKFHQCGMESTLFKKNGKLKENNDEISKLPLVIANNTCIEISYGNYNNALVEGKDFTISALGEIKLKF